MTSPLSAATLFNVQGIVAVITGGGSGIFLPLPLVSPSSPYSPPPSPGLGLTMTKTLVLNGARRIYIIGRRESFLQAAASSIDPNVVIPLQGDVTNVDSLREMSAKVTREEGYIDVLIANAGVMGPRPLKTAMDCEENEEEEEGGGGVGMSEKQRAQQYAQHALSTPIQAFTETYTVNVSAVYYTAMAFLELLVAGNSKRTSTTTSQIITTSSIAAFSRLPGASFAYNSSKAGVTHLTKMLASALVGVRVRCNVLAPGVFPTDMTAGIVQGLSVGNGEGKVDRKVIPAERVGSEEDVAGAVLWMVGRAGGYLNGSVVVVDGGRLGTSCEGKLSLAIASYRNNLKQLRSYASDYLGLLILICGYIFVCVLNIPPSPPPPHHPLSLPTQPNQLNPQIQIQFLASPFHRMFSLDNLSLSYPHATTERVSVPYLFLYAGALPLLLLIAWALVTRPGTHKAHVTLLGWGISMILTMFITDVIKNAVGRPRPDLIARCKPSPGTPAHTLVTWEVCTETNHHVLHDGWRSFPSGHSSFAFSGLGYLALFLAGQCHVYRPRADLARVLLAMAPLLGAGLIAISRCEDYRHDVWDVSVGSLLGMGVAHYTYRRYYPALRNRRCDTPFEHPADERGGWGKVKGDEENGVGAGEFELSDFEEGEDEGEGVGGRR
ncbi:pap2 domain [Pyrenophora seminiperda CCB06]|uniref:Pap2 domain n=1 Tax=Pyrenophora seminiperda CCB06 TaxID=1302712 RepID=A0A3M7M8U5_9PLEO|nr:pap2 domain [Pyrenophora seminiperda CCB06]